MLVNPIGFGVEITQLHPVPTAHQRSTRNVPPEKSEEINLHKKSGLADPLRNAGEGRSPPDDSNMCTWNPTDPCFDWNFGLVLGG